MNPSGISSLVLLVSQGVNLLCREGNSQPGHMQRHDKRRFHGKESSAQRSDPWAGLITSCGSFGLMVCNRRTPLLTVVETRTPEEYNFILKRFSLGIICPLVPQFFEEVAEEIHSLRLTASQGTSNIPFHWFLLLCPKKWDLWRD